MPCGLGVAAPEEADDDAAMADVRCGGLRYQSAKKAGCNVRALKSGGRARMTSFGCPFRQMSIFRSNVVGKEGATVSLRDGKSNAQEREGAMCSLVTFHLATRQ